LEALQALALTSTSSINLKPFLIYFRLSMFYAMCLLDLKEYSAAEIALLKLTDVSHHLHSPPLTPPLPLLLFLISPDSLISLWRIEW
jgi:hypothetical protein